MKKSNLNRRDNNTYRRCRKSTYHTQNVYNRYKNKEKIMDDVLNKNKRQERKERNEKKEERNNSSLVVIQKDLDERARRESKKATMRIKKRARNVGGKFCPFFP